MKSTGVVRRVDELGRLVLPKEIRTTLNIKAGEQVELFVRDGRIVMRKSESACVFCSSTDGVATFKGQSVCCECMKTIAAGIEE